MLIQAVSSEEFWNAYKLHDHSYWDRMLREEAPLLPHALIDPQSAALLSNAEKQQLFKSNIDTVNLELSSFAIASAFIVP